MRLHHTHVLLLVALAACSSLPPSSSSSVAELESVCVEYKDALSKLIMKFLERLRANMGVGIPSLGIPPLDPMQLPNDNIRVKKHYQYDVTGTIINSKLEGLREFNVTSIETSFLHLQANVSVTVPYIFVTGLYRLKGTALGFLPVRGSGPYLIKPSGVSTSVTTTLELTHGHLQIKSMDFTLDVNNLYAKLEGLYGGGSIGNIINSLVNRFGTNAFRRIEPKMHEKIRVALVTQINDILKDIPLSEIIGGISSSSCRLALKDVHLP